MLDIAGLGWMDGRKEGRMDGRTDGRTDGMVRGVDTCTDGFGLRTSAYNTSGDVTPSKRSFMRSIKMTS